MSDYYPEFYLRKRQREQNYRRLTAVAVGFLVLLVVFGVVGYIAFNAFATRQTPPGATPELAEQQQQLQTAEQLASSSVPADVLQNTEQQPPVDLSSISYSESFPQVDVKLAGAAAKAEGDANEVPAEAEVPPAVGREGETAGETISAPVTEDPAAANSAESAAPSGQDTRVGSVTPSDDAEQRKAEQLKRQEQARREAEKREAKKKADEKKKRELEKQKEKDAELAAAKKKEEAAAKPKDDVRAPATKSGGYSYTVYGGTYLSEADAEADRGKLGALGLSGSLIHTGGDYMLVVGKLDDADAASALKNKLQGSGFGGAFVTRKAK